MSPVLALEQATLRLGGRTVLAGVSLAFEPGGLTVVIGANGAGKSTLLRACAGLAAPASGAIRLRGRALGEVPPAERARLVAYLPQGGSVAWPIPVATVAALGRLPHGEAPDRLPGPGREAVARAILAVGLRGFEGRSATELSGGERARLLLARALATEAPVLLADEPVAALDPRHQLLVLERLRERARAGATVVAVMHDLALAARFADRIALVHGGGVAASGRPEDVLTTGWLAEAFGVEAEVAPGPEGLRVDLRRALTFDD